MAKDYQPKRYDLLTCTPSYLKGILHTWEQAGVKTLDDVAGLEKQYQNRKGAKKGGARGAKNDHAKKLADEYNFGF